MPVASDLSPNTDNLTLPTGFCKWKGPGDADYRDLGEVLAFTFLLTATEQQHFSKRQGSRFNDFNATQQLTAEVRLTLEEQTSDNLVLALLGTKAVGPPISIDIGTNSEIVGALRFIGTNDVGPRSQVDMPSVKITPGAALNLLSDGWGNMELTGKVNGDPVTGSFGTLLHNITDEVT